MAPSVTQKVAIVNGTPEILALVESVLSEGHYDVVFIESVAHAYSHIKGVQPNLVVVCVRLDQPESFQVLNMLKLDEETRHIPVLTYTAEFDGLPQNEMVSGDEDEEEDEAPLFSQANDVRMN